MKTKKMFSKVFALLLAVVTVLAMSVTAFAANNDGKITVKNPTIGKAYTAYKVFDLTYSGTEPNQNVAYTYTKNGENDSFLTALQGDGSPFTLTKSTTAGVYNVSLKDGKGKSDISTFLTNNVNSLTAVNTIIPTQDNQTVVFSNLAEGYYYITSGLGSTVTIDSTLNEVTVEDKNAHTPTPVNEKLKTVTNKEGLKVSYSVGQDIPFEVNLNTVNWVNKTDTSGNVSSEQVKKYTLEDTPTNLKIDLNSIEVYVGGTTESDKKEINTHYTASVNETTGKMTVVVYWTNDSGTGTTSLYADGVVLTIKYKAELTAISDENVASNNAVMKYNETEASTGKVTVETGTISVLKYKDGDVTKEKLNGAEFDLYNASTGGNKIELVKNTDGTYEVANSTQKAVSEFSSAKIEAGTATIKGLAAGTYYLEETKAPDGYNKLTERKEITIASTNVGEKSTAVSAEVPNGTGSELPSTGGIGTTIFYVVGTILVAGAAVALIVRKRMSGYEE